MEIGVHLMNVGGCTADGMRVVAQAADRLGLDAVWVSDHVVLPKEMEPNYPYTDDGRYLLDESAPWWEALMTLASLALVTERVQLGTYILVAPLRDPWLLAKQVATLDQLSGGRAVLGIGVGWMHEEFDILHAPFRDRLSRTREMVELMRCIWSENPVSFEGRYWQAPPVGVLPQPVRGAVPVLVGGNSEPAIARAGEYGDGWCPYGLTPEQLADGRRRVLEAAAAAGRDPSATRCYVQVPTWLGEPPEGVRAFVSGSTAAVLDALGRYRDAGADHLVLELWATPEGTVEQLEVFAAEVLPAMREG